MLNKKVTIIGTGSLGTVLAKALNEQGMEIYSLFNRSQELLNEVTQSVKPVYSGSFPEDGEQVGDLIFITTSDDAINFNASKLGSVSDNYFNKIVVHCSGTETSSALTALQEKGAGVAAFHPIQTFTKQSVPEDFNDIYFDLEGDKKAVECLKEVANILNASWFEISPQAKPYLHAAGVTASNYLITLLEMAAMIADLGGIERQSAIEALLPLAQKSLDHAKKSNSLNEALSGPIKRGDDKTVEKHVKLLETKPKLQQLYQKLGKLTVKLATGSDLSSKKQALLEKILDYE